MTKTVTIPYDFDLRPYQLELFEFLDSGGRRAFLRWCRRSGKDLTCINYMFKAMLERPGNYYYILPIYAQGRKAIFEGKTKAGRPYLDHMPKEYIKGNVNKNEMTFETINGSRFRIVGGDNYDTSIVGTGFAGCVISEFALQQPNLMNFLRPILRESNAWLILNGTPRGQNHMFKQEQSIAGDESWHTSIVQTLWPDLPNYYEVATQEDILKDVKEGMPMDMVEQEYGVSYSAGVKGAYYADQVIEAKQQGRVGQFPVDNHRWVDTFWDLGKNDSTVIWFRQQVDGKLIWVDYYEDTGKSPADYVQILQEKGYRYKTHYMPHDADHNRLEGCLKTIFETCMESAGIASDICIAEKPQTKRYAIDKVRSRFSKYYFNESLCADGLAKLALYHRKFNEKDQVFLDMPVHDWTSHAADALSTEALTAEVNDHSQFANSEQKIISNFNPWDY